jgi:serine/threonine protein phosphatase PrpC
LDANPAEVLKEIFEMVQEEMVADEAWDSYLSGTTAVIGIVVDGKIHSAHVGDSKLVLVSQKNGVLQGKSLTMYNLINSDHTCENPLELKRLHLKGARVEQLVTDGKSDGPLRIFKGSLPYPGFILN